MADVIDTPLRLIAELTIGGALAGRYQLEFQRRVEDNGVEIVPPSVRTRELTSDEGAAILNTDASGKAAEVQALSQQVASLQNTETDLRARLAAALDALRAVARADGEWETTPRSQVIAVLQSEA